MRRPWPTGCCGIGKIVQHEPERTHRSKLHPLGRCLIRHLCDIWAYCTCMRVCVSVATCLSTVFLPWTSGEIKGQPPSVSWLRNEQRPGRVEAFRYGLVDLILVRCYSAGTAASSVCACLLCAKQIAGTGHCHVLTIETGLFGADLSIFKKSNVVPGHVMMDYSGSRE